MLRYGADCDYPIFGRAGCLLGDKHQGTDSVQFSTSNEQYTHAVEYTPWRNTLQSLPFVAMRLREVLAKNLKRLRLAADLSQEDLAHRAEIDRTYVSSLERGRYSATVDMLERLAAVLGVKPADLLADPPAGFEE